MFFQYFLRDVRVSFPTVSTRCMKGERKQGANCLGKSAEITPNNLFERLSAYTKQSLSPLILCEHNNQKSDD